MARLTVACAVLLALAGCGGADKGAAARAPGVKYTPAAAHRLDVALKEKVEDTGVPGATAAVVFADGREWSGVAGDAVLRPRRPMTTATAIPFDSVTKIVTASTAMRLVEQGKLSLDDPISKWYPAWRGDAEATVRDLLGHTSGLPGGPPDAYFIRVYEHPHRPATRQRFVAATGKPGARTEGAEYSDAGFVLAGLILERAGGAPIATLARRDVLSAPGGDGLAFQPGERAAPPHAHSYAYPPGVGRPVDANDRSAILPRRAWVTQASGAIGLAGDVPSLARWGSGLLGGRLLEPASLQEMQDVHGGPFWSSGYGLGLAKSSVDDHELWGHTGDGLGTHTELWYLPKERVTVAVAWNDGSIDNDGGIFQALVRAAVGSR
jgi:D-alanyl-D-alanine carboxypeptidase